MTCHAHALAASRRMLCAEDVDLIRETVAKLPPDALVYDVGAGSGTTALAVFAERKDVELVSIDHVEQNLNWTQQALENAGAPMDRWHRHPAQSSLDGGRLDALVDADIEKSTHTAGIDFVILDASHDLDEVTQDIEAWLPKIRAGGYILFHDYDALDAPNLYIGVKLAVDRWLKDGSLGKVERRGWSLLTEKPRLTVGKSGSKVTVSGKEQAMVDLTAASKEPKPKRRKARSS